MIAAMVRDNNDVEVHPSHLSHPTCFEFNPALFWDIQCSSLDIEGHSRFIIERVVSRGVLADWHLLKKLYGKEKIREEVVRMRSLDRKTVSFLSVYFGIAKKDFRCCS
ncbi:DUF6922 domain-containing protein [Desulfobulbus rhabdoformis]|uniref:DUF6922 domain-containing protein n=1 Tax=Desulfobulbus rhabdoformis TaxID=34032 RepID=UPI003B836314